jgi:hypothetical protein
MTLHVCPGRDRWQQHLRGGLPAGEELELYAHLDSCAACRAVIESLTAADDALLDVARAVGEDGHAHDNAIRAAIAAVRRADDGPTQSPQMAADAQAEFPFLDPPAGPGELGRLGHYVVQGIVGRGGMGVVFKALDARLNRVVAIKVLGTQYATDAGARQRFEREAKAAAAVSHDHVVPIYHVDEHRGATYLVMPLIIGSSLQERLTRSGPLALKEILRIGMQTASGLAAAHKQGLVHRDIKPANILLENGVERVKITDFGLARAVDDASLTQSGIVAGTPMYMSPEQAGGQAVDHRSDLFSLGSVLYAMATGEPPFRASGTMAVLLRVCHESPPPLRAVNPDVPEWLEAIVARLHAKIPGDRFQSAQEVADLLSEHLAHLQQPGRAPSPAPLSPPAAAVRQRPAKAGWLLIVGIVLIGGCVLLVPAGGIVLAILFILPAHPQPAPTNHGDHRPDGVVDPDVRPVKRIGEQAAPVDPPVGPKLADAKPPAPADSKAAPGKTVALFNGTDLAGWKVYPERKGEWEVKDQVLVGRGPTALLFSERGDYRNFMLHVEAKVNDGGYGGVFIRTPAFTVLNALSDPEGHKAVINSNSSKPQLSTMKTGSLWMLFQGDIGISPGKRFKPPPPPGQWFSLDVTARGPDIHIAVDNNETVVFHDNTHGDARGFLVLQVLDKSSEIAFRKIEITELPADK